MMKKERKIFEDFLRSKNLKLTRQRFVILEALQKSKRHLTAEELYKLVKKRHPYVGYSTIYRTLKLLCEAGICNELNLDDNTVRYEFFYGHKHHDHLICIKCGKFIEIVEPRIEKLQEEIAKKKGFILKNHRFQLYGICKDCRKI